MFLQSYNRDSYVDIKEATNYLLSKTISKFSRNLDKRYSEYTPETSFSADELRSDQRVEELPELVAELHLNGINIRYLLLIYYRLRNATIKKIVLTEATARIIKHLLEHKWRKLQSPEEGPYLTETREFFQYIFNPTAVSHKPICTSHINRIPVNSGRIS